MTALTAEQTRLVEQYLPKVAVLARILATGVSHASADELHSAGCEGLIEAAQRYDPDSGVPFAGFAHYRVRGAMIDAARRAAPQVRRRSRALRALQASQALLEQAQRTQPSPDVSDPRSLRERVAAATDLVAQTTAAVMLARLAPVDPELVADPEDSIEESIGRSQALVRLRRLVEATDAESQAMITALYVDGLSMHEYAAKTGVHVSTISRHHARLLAQLAAAMAKPDAPGTEPRPRPTGSTAVAGGERPTASPRGPPGRPES
jgi:RNA polymerase sigma factor for flagellar operon FliA